MNTGQSRLARAARVLYVIAVWVCTEAVALLFGFGIVATVAMKPGREVTAALILVGALLVPPIVFVLATWSRWRKPHRENCCAKCGYSLAGLGAGAPCPECGKTKAER